MIAQHAAMARTLAEQLDLSEPVLESLGAAYEQWDGRGWPGTLSGTDVPIAARLSQLSEVGEAAPRVGGVEAEGDGARRAGKQFDRVAGLVRDEERCCHGADAAGTWDAVIDAEPALAVVLWERF
jgi:hypothetical protein